MVLKTAAEYFAVRIAPERAAKTGCVTVFKSAHILLVINAHLQRAILKNEHNKYCRLSPADGV
jgi:hypothetical protein